MRPLVFLDTNVLLPGFAAWRNGKSVPLAVSDPEADRCTFEKCIFGNSSPVASLAGLAFQPDLQ